jgi:hypothetical protein
LFFDVSRKVVIRVFDSELDPQAVLGHIRRMRKVSHLAFAPDIHRWDQKAGWVEMALMPGTCGWTLTPDEPGKAKLIYDSFIAPILTELAMLDEPVRCTVRDRVQNAAVDWTAMQDDRLSSVRRFYESVVEKLRPIANRQVWVTFSHGDFSPHNMIKTPDGVAVIDWEDSGHQCLLHDLYNHFYTTMHHSGCLDLRDQIDAAIAAMARDLASLGSPLAEALDQDAEIYRHLFYIERLCNLITHRSLSTRHIGVVRGFTDVLAGYEEALRPRL